MSQFLPHANRRQFLQAGAWGTLLWTVPGLLAEELVKTPSQTEGPFYPDHLPLDTDNDLLVLNDSLTPAVGEVTYLSGQIDYVQEVVVKGPTKITGKHTYQVCDDRQCLAPVDKSFEFVIN